MPLCGNRNSSNINSYLNSIGLSDKEILNNKIIILEFVNKIGPRLGKTKIAQMLIGRKINLRNDSFLEENEFLGIMKNLLIDEVILLIEQLFIARNLKTNMINDKYPVVEITDWGLKSINSNSIISPSSKDPHLRRS